jgi:hypothetical protein
MEDGMPRQSMNTRVRPSRCEEKDGKTVVTSHLAGNFPGSPVDLRFFSRLEGEKIASLEIIP